MKEYHRFPKYLNSMIRERDSLCTLQNMARHFPQWCPIFTCQGTAVNISHTLQANSPTFTDGKQLCGAYLISF